MSQTKTILLLAQYTIILASIGYATHSYGMKKKLTIEIPNTESPDSSYSDSSDSSENPVSPSLAFDFVKLREWEKTNEDREKRLETYFPETVTFREYLKLACKKKK